MAPREEHNGKPVLARVVEGVRLRFTLLTIFGFLGLLLASIAINYTRSDLAATLRVVALGWILVMLAARKVAKTLSASALRSASDLNRPANDNGGGMVNRLGD